MTYKALIMQMKLADNSEERILAEELLVNQIEDMKKVFDKLAKDGGCLVSSADCSEMEIADARAREDFYLDGSLGFVRRLPQWLVKHSRFARGLSDDCCETGSQPAEKK